MKITQQLPSATGLAASSTGVIVCPIGLTYEEIYLNYGGGTFSATNISALRVIANGKPIQEYRTGAELNTYALFDKRTTAATNKIFVIDFNRRLLKTKQACELTALGTGLPVDNRQVLGQRADGTAIPNPNYNPFPVQTLTIEIDFDANLATPTLTTYARQSDPGPTGLIRKRRKFTYGPASTTFEIADLPKGDFIDRIFINYGVKHTLLEVLRENYTIFKRTPTVNKLILTDDNVRSPQASLDVIDTTETGNGGEWITTAGINDFRIRLTYSTTPTTCNLTVDYIGHLDR